MQKEKIRSADSDSKSVGTFLYFSFVMLHFSAAENVFATFLKTADFSPCVHGTSTAYDVVSNIVSLRVRKRQIWPMFLQG